MQTGRTIVAVCAGWRKADSDCNRASTPVDGVAWSASGFGKDNHLFGAVCGILDTGPESLVPTWPAVLDVVFSNDGKTMDVVDYGEVFTDFTRPTPFYTVPASGVIWTVTQTGG